MNENNENKLIGYLNIFSRRRFPLSYDRLIDLARSSNENLALAALDVLNNIKDTPIHSFAIELINHNKFYGEAIDLLVANYQEEDNQLKLLCI